MSRQIYSVYLDQPHSAYKTPEYPEEDGKYFGYFSFDYYPGDSKTGEKNRIKVHFLNRNRGKESGLSPEFASQRRNYLIRMFSFIKDHYPQAEEVVGGSWLYAMSVYRESFPAEFTENMKRLVPKGSGNIPNSVPNMSFEGNSVWGQFVNRFGEVREHTYREFLGKVNAAKSLEDLVEAFPDKPYQPRVPISVFYKWIDSQLGVKI